MRRIVVLIDGFNLYHALDYCHTSPNRFQYRKYKWLDLVQLACKYIYNKNDVCAGVYYFTARPYWNLAKVARQQIFLDALIENGTNVVFGEFKERDKFCNLCKCKFKTHEEKQTDINIAITLLELAAKDAYDTAIIISGDSDLIPAIRSVQTNFPGKQVGVVIPIGKASENLKRNANFHYKMKEPHLISCLMPDPFVLRSGATLACPPSWK